MLRPLTSEKNLLSSELRYRRLFETAQDGILILDGDTGKITDANPFIQNILGYSHADLLGKELWEIGIFKDILGSKEAFIELQINGYIRYADLPLQTKDGRTIDVEFISNVYMVDDQKVIQCNIRDITDRKVVEKIAQSKTEELERLSKSQEDTKQAMLNVMEDLEEAKAQIELEKVKDEAMLASIGEGLIAVDNDRRILIINKTAGDMLGWKVHDVVGKILTSFILEDELGHFVPIEQRPIYIALKTGKLTSSTFYYTRKDATRLALFITVTPIQLAKDQIGAIIIIRDATREKEIDRAKSEFVSLASHQLRTPLGIMKWYLEALENNDYFLKLPKIMQEYFREIYKSNERVLSLVRDLLSVSRIDQRQIKNAVTQVDLAEKVRQIVEQLEILNHQKKIPLRLTIRNDKIPPVMIDVLRFHEVLENLIGNAILYTETSGTVDVIVKKIHDTLSISVKDTGIGISQADQKKLFTKFFRSEKAIKYHPEGSGLGLYVVKSYVEGWGGKISVKSVEKKGSTFMISLPIVQKNDPSTVNGYSGERR